MPHEYISEKNHKPTAHKQWAHQNFLRLSFLIGRAFSLYYDQQAPDPGDTYPYLLRDFRLKLHTENKNTLKTWKSLKT